ncbi:uncharacterized protein LOC132716755 [Ruditapes philippinarum]|uniref:uncharacterized protein LOC132716755 n=1 Tax=Ruditapes philippinarum TaxID=129788 RepID=UPI00295BD669|nr:uncharacterized protein LOC132716755 [Ruditapes philippinarum]
MPLPPPKSICTDTDSILNEKRQIPVYTTNIYRKSYKIISTCPDDQSSLRHPHCRHPKNLEDYIVVSDNQFEVNFINRHCAACNGVSNVTKWHLHAECPEIMTTEFNSFKERNNYILRKCHLNIEPPHRKIAELTRCYKNDNVYVSTCPSYQQSEHQFNGYDMKKLEKACRKRRVSQNTIFKDPMTGEVYSNVYCFLCNNPDQIEIPWMCQVEDMSSSDDVTFSAMIGEFSNGGVRNGPCEDTEVQDKFTGTCRHLRCPMSTIPVRGQCVSTVEYSNGFTLYVLFKIEFLEGNASFSHVIRRSVERYIEELHKTSNTACGLCEMQFFQFESTLLYRLPLYTTKSCSVFALIDFVRSLVLKNANNLPRVCKGENGTTRFVLRLYQNKMPRVDIYHSTSEIGKRCILKPLQIDNVLLQDCPHFRMAVDDLFRLNPEMSALETYLNPHGFISVCTDAYFQMFGLSSAADNVELMLRQAIELVFMTLVFTLL